MMAKILGFCVTLVVFAVISEARPYYEYYSYGVPVACNNRCQQQRYQQFNVDVQGALNQILGTVTLALKSFDRYVQVLGEKQGPEIVVVGSGQQNMNRVTINGKQSPNTL
ncbi:uncharacterized protein LOC120626452 [Pararge aegeria]|uniref:uncharacterized protein LOC120626452 n=1 Tax=Pararge aegeria TaxID=116150 RepID=UPI0019CFF8FE|nr:uncharacterized protein LOC120626452 [Pararge aegeria]